MRTLLRAVAVLVAVLSIFLAGSSGAIAHSDGKVYVCKYVGTPGEDERLQTGQNPIEVSVNAIPDYAGVGSYFADAQGRSFVIATVPQDPEPTVSDCPGGPQPSTSPTPSVEPSVEPSVSVTPSSSPSATPSSTPSNDPTEAPSPSATPSSTSATNPTLPPTDTEGNPPSGGTDDGWALVAAMVILWGAMVLLLGPRVPASRRYGGRKDF